MLEKLYDLESEIYDMVQSSSGENELTNYHLLVRLYYEFENWTAYGEDTLDDVKKFKKKLKKNLRYK